MNISHTKLLQILKGRFSATDIIMIGGNCYPIRIIKALCGEIKRLKIDYKFYMDSCIIRLDYDNGGFTICPISDIGAKRVMVYIGGEEL